MNVKKIGVLGGTFDPIHLGHKKLAESALKEAELDEVIIMPNNIQPFKVDKDVSTDFHRLNMVNLTFKKCDKISVSTLEVDKDDISYTYDTLKILKEGHRKNEIFFILGTDSFMNLDQWYKGIELLKEFNFICGVREGYEEDDLDLKSDEYFKKYSTKTIKLKTKLPLISASEIRRLASEGKPINHLVTGEVEKYIRDNGLYLKSTISDIYSDDELLLKIDDYLKNHMSAKRREHTYGVVKMAVKLANMLGCNTFKARIAAMFHDILRDLKSEELNEYIRKLDLPKKYIDNPNLSHGKIATYLMKTDYGIRDEDILNAVSFHTTGRQGMSLLEKIIYISDAVEENRDYPGVDDLREALKEDLDSACYKALTNTIEHVKSSGIDLDQDTICAKAYFEKIIKDKRGELC